MTKTTDLVDLSAGETFVLKVRDRLLTEGDALTGAAAGASLRIAGRIRATEGDGIDLSGKGIEVRIAPAGQVHAGLKKVGATGPAEDGLALRLSGNAPVLENAGLLAGIGGVAVKGNGLTGLNTAEILARGGSEGSGIGFDWRGNSGSFESSGSIVGVGIGVSLGDSTSRGLTFSNTGSVEAAQAAVLKGAVTLNNSGTLTGADGTAVTILGARAVLDNSGRIEGDVVGAGGGQTLHNSGEILGGVRLGVGSDTYLGTGRSSVRDGVFGNGGRDHLSGGRSGDRLDGGAGHDRIAGNGGRDKLIGGIGNDTLTGGQGNDRLQGGAGADVFVFAPGHGTDKILDFTDGRDAIDLAAFDLRTIAAIKVEGVLTDTPRGALLDLGIYGGDTILLVGLHAHQIGAADFEPF